MSIACFGTLFDFNQQTRRADVSRRLRAPMSYLCPNICGRAFQTPRGVSNHLRQCKPTLQDEPLLQPAAKKPRLEEEPIQQTVQDPPEGQDHAQVDPPQISEVR